MSEDQDRTAPDATPGHSGPRPDAIHPGTTVGHYTLLRFIAEGGMGEVWLAERSDTFRQRVAVKILTPGRVSPREAIARFEREREVLASLNHPHVAKIHDGGIHAGRPWFAMELVDGEPITAFCDRHGLDLPRRLNLFRQVCDAVTHAHRRGIIHRDLKPSNILVSIGTGSEPQAKVIDFGIAKAMAGTLSDGLEITEELRPIGTLEYMSPEQADPAGQDLDTRTDVYSLGIVLYELLAGIRPFDIRGRAELEIRRIIREDEAPTPSLRLSTVATRDAEAASRISRARRAEIRSLVSSLRGELEWIPLKAIRKDRERRYRGADELSADIANYLDGRPLIAAPESVGYRVRKFVGRHRLRVTAASAVATAVVVGLGVATWQWRRAEVRAAELQLVSEFQANMLASIDATDAGLELMTDLRRRLDEALEREGIGSDERMNRGEAVRDELVRLNATDAAAAMVHRTLLEPAVREIDRRFVDLPEVDARLRQALADVYGQLGLPDRALPLQERAVANRTGVLGADHPETLRSSAALGALLLELGRIEEAKVLLDAVLDTRRKTLGNDHPDTITSIHDLGLLAHERGDLEAAETLYRDALERSRRTLGGDHDETLSTLTALGSLLQELGKLEEAERCHREAWEARRARHGDRHPETLIAIGNLGGTLNAQGRVEECADLLIDTFELTRELKGEEHPQTLSALNNLGFVLRRLGRVEEAERTFRDTIEIRTRVLGPFHSDTLVSTNNLAALLMDSGRPAEAEPLFRRVLEGRWKRLDPDHADTLLSMNNLGVVLSRLGRNDEAESLLRGAFLGRREKLGPDHAFTLASLHGLCTLLTMRGANAEAVELLAAHESGARSAWPDRLRPMLANHLAMLGRARAGLGFDPARFPLADANLREAHTILVETRGAEDVATRRCATALAKLHDAWHAAVPDGGHDSRADEWRSKGTGQDPSENPVR
jgi:serine/threonine protein kinase/tetratricopeptide (TPR) repeat protein